jgi:hypothetical protein
MTPTPLPRTVERLGELLVPPAAAEHVLGDLAESSRTPREYLRRLLTVLPYVVLAQVRRRAGTGVGFNALHSAGVLLAWQWIVAAPDLNSPAFWAALFSVWGIWVGGCALAAAYGPRDKPIQWNAVVLSATVILAMLAALLLPGLSALAAAWAMAFVLATSPVMSMPWISPYIHDTVRIQQRLWFGGDEKGPFRMALLRHFCMWGAAWPGVALLVTRDFQSNAGIAFLWVTAAFAVAAIIAGRTWGGFPREVPDHWQILAFHRMDISHRLRLLRVPLWLYIPGLETRAIRMAVRHPELLVSALPALAALVVAIWLMYLLATRFLERQLDQLAPLVPSA